jgi:hypothetical protein
MHLFRTVSAFVAATLLNGSVALAVSPTACLSVCARAIDVSVAPPARPAHVEARARALAAPDGAAGVQAVVPAVVRPVAETAPPRRPEWLAARARRAVPDLSAVSSRAASAPLAPAAADSDL